MLYQFPAKSGRYKGVQLTAELTPEKQPAIQRQVEYITAAMENGLELEPSRFELSIGGIPIG